MQASVEDDFSLLNLKLLMKIMQMLHFIVIIIICAVVVVIYTFRKQFSLVHGLLFCTSSVLVFITPVCLSVHHHCVFKFLLFTRCWSDHVHVRCVSLPCFGLLSVCCGICTKMLVMIQSLIHFREAVLFGQFASINLFKKLIVS